MAVDVVVAASGLATGAGLSTAEVAAAVRARSSRFIESSVCDHRFRPVVFSEVPAPAVPPLADALDSDLRLTGWLRRLVQLAGRALGESTRRANIPAVPLFLALPEGIPAALGSELLLPALSQQTGRAFDLASSDASFRGRAGGLLAIGTAAKAVRDGKAPVALAGAVDSYRNLLLLAGLETRGRLRTPNNLDGFIPGEGAAFLLLAQPELARQRGLDRSVSVTNHALAEEPGHVESAEPCRGDGLATAISTLLAAALSTPIRSVFSSMNGESYWAKEWGVAYVRNRPGFHERFTIFHPADSHGDLGAASGVANVALAAHALVGHYCESPALVYGSSDGAERAALVVATLDT